MRIKMIKVKYLKFPAENNYPEFKEVCFYCSEGMANEVVDEIVKELKKVPSEFETINFSWQKLNRLGVDGLIEIVRALPSHVTQLDLSKNELDSLGVDGLIEILSNLPPNVTKLNLSETALFRLGAAGLATVLSNIPAHVTEIDLSKTGLAFLSSVELGEVLSQIPSHVKYVSLAGNGLNNYGADNFANALLPLLNHATVSLSYNQIVYYNNENYVTGLVNKIGMNDVVCSDYYETHALKKPLLAMQTKAAAVVNKVTDFNDLIMSYVTNSPAGFFSESKPLENEFGQAPESKVFVL